MIARTEIMLGENPDYEGLIRLVDNPNCLRVWRCDQDECTIL